MGKLQVTTVPLEKTCLLYPGIWYICNSHLPQEIMRKQVQQRRGNAA